MFEMKKISTLFTILCCIFALGLTASPPVALTNFSIEFERPQGVILTWQTITEINTNYIAVERSFDANNFEEISRLAAQGTVETTTDYEFIDAAIYYDDSEVFYRLKFVDENGNYEYSERVMINPSAIDFDTSPGFTVQNPFNESIAISVSAFTESKIITELFTVEGERIAIQHDFIWGGEQNIYIQDVAHLAKGIYFMRTISTTGKMLHSQILFKK